MNPPSKDAIGKALDILLESVREENGYTFPTSRTVPLNDIPFEELATHADALSSAKSHLAKEADELISRIQLHRNLAAPIHRLPEEIFERILEMTETGPPAAYIPDLLLFRLVGRLWHATISNSTRLWTRMDMSVSPRMAQMVIRLSNGRPLSLFWNTVDQGGRYDPILDIAVQNSTRFKSMDLRVGPSDPFDIRRLLTSPTPALESLIVKVMRVAAVFRGRTDPVVQSALSEGAPLKHLTLTNFTLTIDPHRLSNLVTLFLEGSAVPTSLGTLLQILSTSAQLEQLTISNNARTEGVPQPRPLIALPRLENLKIDQITVDYCMALLGSIYAPACSRVDVGDAGWGKHADSLDALVWQPGSLQAAALLGFISSSESQISEGPATISITQISTTISVIHSTTMVLVKEKGGFRSRLLKFRRSEPLKLLKLIGESLRHLLYPSTPSLSLSRPLSQHDSIHLRPWSSTLESLRLLDYTASLSAMEQLSQCITTPGGAGPVATESWTCPNLRSITLQIPGKEEEECAIYIAALRSLVRKRWSGEDGDLAPAIQPDWFVIVSPRYGEFQDVESEIQRVLPSFKFD